MIFSDSSSVLKGISNSSKMNNTSHITQMLKDKIERLQFALPDVTKAWFLEIDTDFIFL
jgi:hypothetical protein